MELSVKDRRTIEAKRAGITARLAHAVGQPVAEELAAQDEAEALGSGLDPRSTSYLAGSAGSANTRIGDDEPREAKPESGPATYDRLVSTQQFDLWRFAEKINAQARRTIVEDGEHASMFFLVGRDGRVSGHLFDAIEQRPVIEHRRRQLGEAVARSRAVAAAFVSEAWVASPDGIPVGDAVGDDPGARDALVVAAMDVSSYAAFETLVMKRPDGTVALSESVRRGPSSEVEVFKHAWEFWRSPEGAAPPIAESRGGMLGKLRRGG